MQKAGVKGPAFCVQGYYSKALKDFLFSLYKENYLNEIRADTRLGFEKDTDVSPYFYFKENA